MAVLSYFLTQSCFQPDYYSMISADTEKFGAEQWFPYLNYLLPNAEVVTLTTHFPIAAAHQPITAFSTQSYFDDFYNRIHINPSSLALGNVASEQVSTVDVWNAYLVPKTLSAINDVPEGIGLSGQPNAPFNFTGLQERIWTISIGINGPSDINATINFVFGVEKVTLKITGSRIVAFGWPIDWGQPVLERMDWLTDIMRSDAGYEQRRALRLTPRISYEAEVLVYGAERQYFDHCMTGWSARTFVVPVWPQQQWLTTAHAAGATTITCDTTSRNFRAGRLAVVRGETAMQNETVEILNVLAGSLTLKRPLLKAWPKGTLLTPAVTAQLNEPPQLIKRTDSIMRTHVVFNVNEAVDHPEALPATLYRSYPVFEDKPNETNDLTHSYERLMQQLDNKTGLTLQSDTAAAAFRFYQHSWLTAGRVQQAALRALFYALRGAQKAMWIPTHCSDLTIKADIPATTSTLDIQLCGYTRFSFNQLGRTDIRLVLRNGSVLYRRIVLAIELDSSTERLSVDSSFSSAILAADVVMISYISLCRLSNDSVSIEHITDSDGVAKCDVTFRGVRET